MQGRTVGWGLGATFVAAAALLASSSCRSTAAPPAVVSPFDAGNCKTSLDRLCAEDAGIGDQDPTSIACLGYDALAAAACSAPSSPNRRWIVASTTCPGVRALEQVGGSVYGFVYYFDDATGALQYVMRVEDEDMYPRFWCAAGPPDTRIPNCTPIPPDPFTGCCLTDTAFLCPMASDAGGGG